MKQAAARFALWGILGLSLATQSGCILVAAAAGTGAGVAYVRGDLETTFEAGPKDLADATERAFKQMDIALISKTSSNLDGKLIGRTAQDDKLEVCITGQSERVSTASIRLGTFGNSAMQEHVATEIRKQLSLTASAAPATQPTTQPTTRPGMADVR